MPAIRVALLGPPRIQRDDAPVQMDTRKATALLAYLAMTGEAQGRDALAGLLWPDTDQQRARAALRRTLSTLGKALGGGLTADRATIRLDPDAVWLDVRRFRALVAACDTHGHPAAESCPACVEPLAEAIALHRGDFLAGFALRDADTFDDWQRFQAEGLRRELAGALERLVGARVLQRQWAPAITDARRWLALDPLHEPAHRQLMSLYAWSGQRAAALRQYQECARVLDRELGVGPLEQTTALHQAILENRVAAPPAAAAAPATAEAGPARGADATPGQHAAPAAAPAPPLVGRSTQWQGLLAAWAATGPDGRLVVVEGEAGIGKTRLAEELVAHADTEGAATVTSRCYQEEAGLAYGVLVEGLRARLAHPDAAARVAGLAVHWLVDASRLLPELGDLHPGLPAAPPLDSPGAQSRLFEAVSQVLAAACGSPRPGVVLLDDVHWADEASLDVLAYLVRRLPGRPLCVVVTWRTEQVPPGHRLRRLAGEARRAGAATLLHLDRLRRPDVAELVRAVAPAHAERAEWLYQETEGLPLFLVEYLAELPATGVGAPLPAGMRELLQARVAGVGQTARQVLAAGAVLGRSFDVETVRAASGRGDEETVLALEELAGHGLIREVGDAPEVPTYDFSHEKLQALVYQETSLARRRLLHRRVAEALTARSRAHRDHGASAASIAHHLRLGGREDAAAAVYRLAGDHARGLYANTEALAHYQAALALGHPDTALLHAAIGDLETLLGDYDAALASYQQATTQASPGQHGSLQQRLGNLHHRRGDWQAAERHFAAALTTLEGADATEKEALAQQARLHADWSLTAHHRGDPDRASEQARRALELAEAAGDTRALAQAHNLLGMLSGHLGDNQRARRHLERSLALAETLPDPSARVAALNNLALTLGAAGQPEQAVRLAETALELCAAQGDRHRQAALHNNLADLLHAQGHTEASMAHLKQAVAIFAEVGEPARLQPEIWKLVEW
jgi:DNA-binding SARP family transcriptional activator